LIPDKKRNRSIKIMRSFLLDKGAHVLLIRAMENIEIKPNIKKNIMVAGTAAGTNWCWPG
jgi:hypothetical protein